MNTKIESRTEMQMAAVIVIDICARLNKLNLDRAAYQAAFNAEMTARCGFTVPLELLTL